MVKHRIVRIKFRPYEHSCSIPNCAYKKRNGRCSLTTNFFGLTNGVVDYSKCLDYEEREVTKSAKGE